MKAVFFSNDRNELEQISTKLIAQHIPCEIRDGLPADNDGLEPGLWIQRDEDLSRAFMECVRNGIGLAKRKSQAVEQDARQLFMTVCTELMSQPGLRS